MAYAAGEAISKVNIAGVNEAIMLFFRAEI
jgi:hypothetical protein